MLLDVSVVSISTPLLYFVLYLDRIVSPTDVVLNRPKCYTHFVTIDVVVVWLMLLGLLLLLLMMLMPQKHVSLLSIVLVSSINIPIASFVPYFRNNPLVIAVVDGTDVSESSHHPLRYDSSWNSVSHVVVVVVVVSSSHLHYHYHYHYYYVMRKMLRLWRRRVMERLRSRKDSSLDYYSDYYYYYYWYEMVLHEWT